MTKVYQNYRELAEFIELLRVHDVRSFLEIGSKWGGTLRNVAASMPKGSRVVSVDTNLREPLVQSIGAIRKMGYDTHFILGDSTAPDVVERVRKLGPYGACLIDGNHKRQYVQADWENYGPLCRIVAFHDIENAKEDVITFWPEVRAGRRWLELKYSPTPWTMGIGVIFQ